MDLQTLRCQIDEVDKKIIDLLNHRARLAEEIAIVKKEANLPLYHPDREQEVYQNILKHNTGPLKPQHIQAIYKEIMSAIIDIQGGFSICYFGEEASFTHQAAIQKFGSAIPAKSIVSIKEVFRAVEAGIYRYGVVPVENSTEGVVTHTLDQLFQSNLLIYAEIYNTIHLCLLSHSKDLKEIREIYSHPQAYSQCYQWITENLGNIEFIETSSTSKAARIVSQRGKGCAAIASQLASEVYKVPIQRMAIEDNPKNITRFLVLGYDQSKPTGRDKTSIVCSTQDRPGVLFHLLEPFNRRKINLTRIESRPNKQVNWKYHFFIDMEGHIEDPPIANVIKELSSMTTMLKVLGSYPNASID